MTKKLLITLSILTLFANGGMGKSNVLQEFSDDVENY